MADQTSVQAQLSVRRGRHAVEFYKDAFGAVEVYRVGGDDDNPAVVSQLSVGNATFWVADESPEHENFSPESVGGSTTRMLLVVEDPDATVRRAVARRRPRDLPARERPRMAAGADRRPVRAPLGDRAAVERLDPTCITRQTRRPRAGLAVLSTYTVHNATRLRFRAECRVMHVDRCIFVHETARTSRFV